MTDHFEHREHPLFTLMKIYAYLPHENKNAMQMDFFDLITNRESIRDYDPEKAVEAVKLNKIIEAGRLAPSAANRQPWRFYVVSSDENLAKIRKCYSKSWFGDAPHVLIVAGKRKAAWTRAADGYNALETDLTIAMDHIILAAESLGVGTCWIAAFDPDELKKTGILSGDEEVFAITPLGYQKKDFKKSGNKNRKPFAEVVKFV
jgi:nitroreductase